jgi:serralysin
LFRTNDADDILKGRGGSDEFRSGEGLDKLTGGGGRDVFYFSDAPDANTIKTIKGFRPGSDLIALNFGELGPLINPTGLLDVAYFHRGAGAADANDYIIYNPGNGRVYVDYDGAGSSGQILLARLDRGLDLANTDFQSYLL